MNYATKKYALDMLSYGRLSKSAAPRIGIDALADLLVGNGVPRENVFDVIKGFGDYFKANGKNSFGIDDLSGVMSEMANNSFANSKNTNKAISALSKIKKPAILIGAGVTAGLIPYISSKINKKRRFSLFA